MNDDNGDEENPPPQDNEEASSGRGHSKSISSFRLHSYFLPAARSSESIHS
jgi:hypothetical protein